MMNLALNIAFALVGAAFVLSFLRLLKGPDATADLIGLKPELSCVKTEDEGLYIGQHEYWLQTMKKALKAEQANGGK